MVVHPAVRELRRVIEEVLDFVVVEYGCRKRGRFIVSGGIEVFYWNATTGVRAYVENREPFTVQLCPLPDGVFPPPVRDPRRPEWYDAFDVVRLVAGRHPRFTDEQRYGSDPVVIAAYADALRGPCRPLLSGDPELWPRLRRQRRARIAYNRRRYPWP